MFVRRFMAERAFPSRLHPLADRFASSPRSSSLSAIKTFIRVIREIRGRTFFRLEKLRRSAISIADNAPCSHFLANHLFAISVRSLRSFAANSICCYFFAIHLFATSPRSSAVQTFICGIREIRGRTFQSTSNSRDPAERNVMFALPGRDEVASCGAAKAKGAVRQLAQWDCEIELRGPVFPE